MPEADISLVTQCHNFYECVCVNFSVVSRTLTILCCEHLSYVIGATRQSVSGKVLNYIQSILSHSYHY